MVDKPYARWLGEFIVIVIGVLVALAVDDFRSSRDDRALEAYYLDRLQVDIASDTLQLATLVARLDTLGVGGRLLSRHLGDPLTQPIPSRLSEISLPWERLPGFALFWLGRFEASQSTYEQMTTTGTIRVLRSRDLQEALARYYLAADRISQSEAIVRAESQQPLIAAFYRWGLTIPDAARDSTLVAPFRDDPEVLALIREVSNLPFRVGRPRARLLDRGRELLSAIAAARDGGAL
jgi:hypothetical protein